MLPALQAALAGAGAAAVDAAAGQPEAEAEQAQAVGACRVLEGRGVWRHISRDWTASRALLLALLASGGRVGVGRWAGRWVGGWAGPLPELSMRACSACSCGSSAASAAPQSLPATPTLLLLLPAGAARLPTACAPAWMHIITACCCSYFTAHTNAAAHTGVEAQAAIQRCFLITAFRLTRPAIPDPAAVSRVFERQQSAACWGLGLWVLLLAVRLTYISPRSFPPHRRRP